MYASIRICLNSPSTILEALMVANTPKAREYANPFAVAIAHGHSIGIGKIQACACGDQAFGEMRYWKTTFLEGVPNCVLDQR